MSTLRVRLCPSERVALPPLFCQRPVTPIGVRLVRFEGQYGKVIVLYEEAKKIAPANDRQLKAMDEEAKKIAGASEAYEPMRTSAQADGPQAVKDLNAIQAEKNRLAAEDAAKQVAATPRSGHRAAASIAQGFSVTPYGVSLNYTRLQPPLFMAATSTTHG